MDIRPFTVLSKAWSREALREKINFFDQITTV